MWVKHLIVTLSLVSTVMSYNLMDDGMKSLEAKDDGVIIEIVEEEVREERDIEVREFDIHGLKLKENTASEEVLQLKRFFREKGYGNIKEDYYFDSRTREIVINYQGKNGLTPDGIVGLNTYKKINEDIKLNRINIPEVNLKFNKEIPKGDWIIINKSNNTLYHLNEEKVIKKYHVATGKLPEYTPEGKFTIVTKYVNPAWGGAGRYKPVKGGAPNNPLGKRWMGLSIQGGGVYGIHGNSDKESIGRFVSLGCVRMFNEDVEYLYELIKIGTPVWVGREVKLWEYGISFTLVPEIIEDIFKY